MAEANGSLAGMVSDVEPPTLPRAAKRRRTAVHRASPWRQQTSWQVIGGAGCIDRPVALFTVSHKLGWVAKGILLVAVTPAALMQRKSPHAVQTACQVRMRPAITLPERLSHACWRAANKAHTLSAGPSGSYQPLHGTHPAAFCRMHSQRRPAFSWLHGWQMSRAVRWRWH